MVMVVPRISIIVPVYNGKGMIEECIESLLALDYKEQYREIFVVDNGSTDGTTAILKRYPVTRLAESRRGSTAARNAAVAHARGRIVAFTDADCIVAADWADVIERVFDDIEIDAVIGFADGINETLHATFAQRRWEESWFTRVGSSLELKYPGIDTRNCALRKSIFDEHRGFNADYEYCADLELSIRLSGRQRHVVFCPDMRVRHKNPTSFREMRDKSRKQLPHVMRMLQRASTEDALPFPRSTFLGIAERDFGQPGQAVIVAIMSSIRVLLIIVMTSCFRLGIDRPWSFKLYKLFFGVCYDLAILKAKRDSSWR
jgi:glycosyltransferase involved in cell wall biosynthesis